MMTINGSDRAIAARLRLALEDVGYTVPAEAVESVLAKIQKPVACDRTPNPYGWTKGDEGIGWEDACANRRGIDE